MSSKMCISHKLDNNKYVSTFTSFNYLIFNTKNIIIINKIIILLLYTGCK